MLCTDCNGNMNNNTGIDNKSTNRFIKFRGHFNKSKMEGKIFISKAYIRSLSLKENNTLSLSQHQHRCCHFQRRHLGRRSRFSK